LSETYDGETRVTGEFDYIRRRAFGYNSNNTCSAVAVGIALNYITLQHGNKMVSDDLLSETLGGGHDDGLLYRSDVSEKYPRANALHRYLVKVCHLHAASFAFKISMAVNRYIRKNCPETRLRMKSTLFPKTETIKRCIDNDMPVLITTAITGERDRGFNAHTMCVYGYREVSGRTELLVHTGWYNRKYMSAASGGAYYYEADKWIDKRWALFGYYFTFKDI
jgi:hypothetical protein